MGLDVALCVVILIVAIRGWLQGFLYQAIQIGGLVACVYLADPVRDQAKPYVVPYLPSIQPELVDRLLWWVAAPVTYVVLVGATTLVIKMTRRPEIPGIPPLPRRNNQFAGFLVGVAKGLLIAAFLTAAIEKYAVKPIETISWADEQVKGSWAMRWNNQYKPAARIWTSVPVRHFVDHIQRMGLQSPTESPVDPADRAGERPVVQTASRTPESATDGKKNSAEVPAPPAPAPPPSAKTPKTPKVDQEIEDAVNEINAKLDAAAKPK